MSTPQGTRLNNAEMCDLPTFGWLNPKVDTNDYYVSFTIAWEVDQALFDKVIADGVCGQVVNGRCILTNH